MQYSAERLLSPTNASTSTRILEDDKCRLQRNIAKYNLIDASVTLNATEACFTPRGQRCEVDVLARNCDLTVANRESEVGKTSATGEDESSLSIIIGSVFNLGIVCFCNYSWEES